MPLSREQIADRIEAARIIRGWDQDELARDLAAKTDVFRVSYLGQIERKERDLTDTQREKLATFLRVPEAWFTVKDPFALIAGEASSNGAASDLAQQVSQLAERLAEVEVELENLRQSRGVRRGGEGVGGSRRTSAGS